MFRGCQFDVLPYMVLLLNYIAILLLARYKTQVQRLSIRCATIYGAILLNYIAILLPVRCQTQLSNPGSEVVNSMYSGKNVGLLR